MVGVGNPFVLAETPITFPDMRPEVAGVEWVVVGMVHALGNGYTTKVALETKI